jgi:hypothetical protein
MHVTEFLIRKASLFILGFCCSACVLFSQSIISGDITGTVTDPTGGLVPNATIVLQNVNTGARQSSVTNGAGQYRLAMLPPGVYSLSVSAPGFQNARQSNIQVVAGQATTANIQLSVAASSTTVQVTEAASAIDTENANTTTVFNAQQVLNMPNPGGDLTYIAQTAPGVVMNTQSGYGNFSAQGMPGTSNLFTVNGQNFNDPFLNLNNSGASNLLLGFNDIAETLVINNAYSAQYGQYAGSQVSYTTKSGTNTFHGDAIYMWNGRAVNANNFFNNQAGLATPFDNFNQWATDVNGPIWRDRTFFDADYEGVRVIVPTSTVLVTIPSPQFEAATLANLATNGNAAEIPFYQQMFKIVNSAPGAASATPVTSDGNGGCGTSFTVPGFGAGAAPCALNFRTTPANLFHEYQWTARVDHNFSEKDHGYVRVFRDNGYQPTYTDYFTPVFNAYSSQPQMSFQIAETHTFNPTTVNQFNGSALYYSAVFEPSNLAGALSLLPTVVSPTGAFFSTIGGENNLFPQGRRVFQYQILDDFSKVAGKHTFRMGFSWLHDTITDLDFSGSIHGTDSPASLMEFYNGGGPLSSLTQNFPTSNEEPFRFNTLAGYIGDDWKVSDRLTLSLNLRLESYANPVCANNCFSRLVNTFSGYPADASVPYDQTILFGQRNAFANTQTVVWEPRIGIAWKPTHSDKTVIRTGAGVFADEFPAFMSEFAALNPPNFNGFTISGSELPSGFGAIAPGVPNSLFTAAANANAALVSGFKGGGTLASLSSAVPGFVPPNFTNFQSYMHQPTYYKWNFEIEQAFGSNTVLSVNYAGMHGTYIPIDDAGMNAYCPPSNCPNGFPGLPSAAPDPRFGQIQQYFSAGISNYNGLIVSLQRRLSTALTFNLNYSWSHALDDVSNGGILPLSFGPPLSTNESVLWPQNPFDFRANYANSDLDTRHYVSFGWVMTDLLRHAGFRHGPARIFGGWTLSGDLFFRTGLPYTVIDSGATALLVNYTSAGAPANLFATPLIAGTVSCGVANVVSQNNPCLTLSDFMPSSPAFGVQGRNDFRGPDFFDMDLTLMKDVAITERMTFSFGASAYNVLNHPNFDVPVADINNPQFGSITNVVVPPTSILGSFVGGNASPRFLEIRGVLRF